MQWLIIVDNPKNWKFDVTGATVLSSREYLSTEPSSDRRRTGIINLCRSYAYQSLGYYVSLLAEARGHRAFPSVETIQDFKTPTIVRTIGSDILPTIQKALKPLLSDTFMLSIYFGRNLAQRYDALCRKLLLLFPAPMLRAQFRRVHGVWELENISPITSREIPESHREFVQEAARDFILSRPGVTRKKNQARFDLAMLVDPQEPHPPSNEEALRRFEKTGEKLGIRIERITADNYSELAEFDGLFIRATTAVQHYTYRFARRAKAEDMAVIDDPLSILRCTNKVYLQEILSRKQVPTPRTMILHKDNLSQVVETIGIPCVLKQPDSSFSHGVIKIKTLEEYHAQTKLLLHDSELLVAQEFLPTEYDWRIGVVADEAFYACKYYMARGHWQIYNHEAKVKKHMDGNVDCVPIHEVPEPVLTAATRACALIGNGLYGVDVKLVDGKAFVIEVNDNPSIDGGVEDDLIGEQLYEKILSMLLKRMEAKRTSPAHLP